jgi:DNA-binding NtrC family response regulator
MHRVFRLIEKVARTDSTVLIVGESGTGKELVARSIHLQSRRAEGPFVPVNVGAIPESLIESELFGYTRGAFTGATAERRGLVEEAEGGTLFLDEIGDMPQAAQVKLLRTLESSEVRRLGDNATRIVDVRVVAATHRDLIADVASGRFREDLYYRLNVVLIDLPPLRERREDIGLLASYFLERAVARSGRGPMEFSPEARRVLERYDWPGNVRELENAVEHAVAVTDGTTFLPSDLPSAVTAPRMLARQASSALGTVISPKLRDTGRDDGRENWSLADVERDHIVRVLRRHQGNSTSAAKQLGISRTTLWRKLREYGIRRTGDDA